MVTGWSLPGLLLLLAAAAVLSAPALVSLAGGDLLGEQAPRLALSLAGRTTRLATGWTAAAVVGFQFLHSVRMRTGVTFGISYPTWLVLHQGSGVAFLLAVVAHTGGHWGWHLNGWLTLAVLAAVYGGLAGRLAEVLLTTRALLSRIADIPDRRRGAAAERRRAPRTTARERRVAAGDAPAPALYRFRGLWTMWHLAIALLLVVVLAFHLASVWYF